MISTRNALLALLLFLTFASAAAQTPANDECVDRQSLGLGLTPVNTTGASDSAVTSTCGVGSDLDVFFGYTAANDGYLRVELEGSSIPLPVDLELSTYDDACTLQDELTCGFAGAVQFVPVLAGGETVFRIFGESGPGLLNLEFFPVNPSDDCATAESTSGSFSVPVTNLSSTPTPTSSGCTGPTLDDVFYEYVPTLTGELRVGLIEPSTGVTLSVFADCTLNALEACSLDASDLYVPVVSGVPIIIRLASATPFTNRLRLFVDPPFGGDTCATRGTLFMPTATLSVALSNATPSGVQSSCGLVDETDIYWGIIFSQTGYVTLLDQNIGGPTLDRAVYLDAQSCDLMNEVACEVLTAAPVTFYLPAGQEAVVRYFSDFNTPAGANASVEVEFSPTAMNDECAGAIPISEGSQSLNLVDAGPSIEPPAASCLPDSYRDKYYEYTPPTTGVASIYDLVTGSVEVLDDCTSAVPVGCATQGDVLSFPVTAGDPVILRVATPASSGALLKLELPTTAEFVRGDLDFDGGLALDDAISLLSILFGTPAGVVCLDAADIDGNGVLSVLDAIVLLDFAFSNGPDPAPPFPNCGVPAAGAPTLGCDAPFPTCP